VPQPIMCRVLGISGTCSDTMSDGAQQFVYTAETSRPNASAAILAQPRDVENTAPPCRSLAPGGRPSCRYCRDRRLPRVRAVQFVQTARWRRRCPARRPDFNHLMQPGQPAAHREASTGSHAPPLRSRSRRPLLDTGKPRLAGRPRCRTRSYPALSNCTSFSFGADR